jgi:hypothetical protein
MRQSDCWGEKPHSIGKLVERCKSVVEILRGTPCPSRRGCLWLYPSCPHIFDPDTCKTSSRPLILFMIPSALFAPSPLRLRPALSTPDRTLKMAMGCVGELPIFWELKIQISEPRSLHFQDAISHHKCSKSVNSHHAKRKRKDELFSGSIEWKIALEITQWFREIPS